MLQSRLIQDLYESHFIDLLLTLSSDATQDLLFNQWNTLALEKFYLFFRGAKPITLGSVQAKVCVCEIMFSIPCSSSSLRFSSTPPRLSPVCLPLRICTDENTHARQTRVTRD